MFGAPGWPWVRTVHAVRSMPFLYAPIATPIRPRAVPGGRGREQSHMAMTPAEADKILAGDFAPWVLDLGLSVETLGDDHAVLRLPWSQRLAREGGALSGQALMAAADTAIVSAVPAARGAYGPMTTMRQSTGFQRAVSGFGCPDQSGRHRAGPTSGLTRSANGRRRSVVNSAPNPLSCESAHRMRNQVTPSGSSAQARTGAHVIGEVCRIRRGDDKGPFTPPRHPCEEVGTKSCASLHEWRLL